MVVALSATAQRTRVRFPPAPLTHSLTHSPTKGCSRKGTPGVLETGDDPATSSDKVTLSTTERRSRQDPSGRSSWGRERDGIRGVSDDPHGGAGSVEAEDGRERPRPAAGAA